MNDTRVTEDQHAELISVEDAGATLGVTRDAVRAVAPWNAGRKEDRSQLVRDA